MILGGQFLFNSYKVWALPHKVAAASQAHVSTSK